MLKKSGESWAAIASPQLRGFDIAGAGNSGFAGSLGDVARSLGERSVQLSLKRGFDIAVASLLLIVLSPFLLLMAITIKIDSPGPVFFTQIRWGKNLTRFRVYKFRTMREDLCDPTGVRQTVMGDVRVTRTGSFMRRMNFDELPQLLNVIKGDMSLVGPRCHPVGMLAAGMPYEKLVPGYHQRHAMRPGVTGLAQMNGLRGPTICPVQARARIDHDLEYVRNFNLLMDLKIIWGTACRQMLGGDGF
jgi:lipopolysaccharide/colanic/teichoic acid biosynthesis glycosyltransferase